MHKKWSKICEILGKSISPGQFKLWIGPLAPVPCNEGLLLHAPTEFVCAHVRSWFTPHLEKAATEVTGNPCAVHIEFSAGCPKPDLLRSVRAGTSEGQSGDKKEPLPKKCSPPEPGNLPAAVCPPSPKPLPQEQLFLPLSVGTRAETARQEPVWRFSFDDFIIGPGNRLAHAASLSICETEKRPDMLFLSSAPGLGKTHLMQAIGNSLSKACNRRKPRMEYLTAEEFASRFVLALKAGDMPAFKARHRDLDLLLLEDIHFLQGKNKTQVELLAVLKSIRDHGGKIVFSSSFAPQDMRDIDEQLLSRLSAGLMSFIERPDEDTRRRILRHKASVHQIRLPEDVEDVLARHVNADVRQIESCLQTLIFKAAMLNSAITPGLAWEVVSRHSAYCPAADMESIIHSVCRAFGISREQLLSESRKQEYVTARNTAFYLARKHTALSLEAVGRCFNRRHSTVIKGITGLEREISRKSPVGLQLANTLEMIEKNGGLTMQPV
ncbi:MAG: chromosomal replication initiator protein DnaA [Desulfovibrio sp.]|jgi:chromosomal replication initiator protein|nr:chromosomal replication initiator protein DnaA [Desulfovibrio sp.]